MSSEPLSPIENTHRSRRRFPSPIKIKDLPSPRKLFRSSKHCKEEREEKKRSNALQELCSISLPKTHEMQSELPSFNLSPIKKLHSRDHRDRSFQTQDTVSESDSEDGSASVSCKQNVRFADEVGLPLQSILHYECDEHEHRELVVLCLCPQKKVFEFLHVGYHGATVRDLLEGLPGMCTNQVFEESKFTSLHRNSGLAFFNLAPDFSHQRLRECGFRENEVVVAAIEGSPERAVLEGIGPLLGNAKILKTLKRARRSRRGLKMLIGKNEHKDEMPYHLQKRSGLLLRRKKQSVELEELGDEACNDPLYDAAEYHRQLMFGILAISSGTILFSALGM